MKKIINKTLAVAATTLLVVACQGDKKTEESSKSEQDILQEVHVVHAIGKVSPSEDWSVISSPTAARIKTVLIQEGDTVSPGQLLVVLESGTSDLNIDAARARLTALRAENKTTEQELQRARVAAEELKSKYETSKVLYDQQAETRERVEADYSNWQQQELSVRALEQKVGAQRASENEQRIQVRTAERDAGDYRITAPAAGVVVDLTAQVGQSVNSADALGKIVDLRQSIVEAEVDELFAHDVQVGQEVYLSAVGRKDTLARGVVFYISPILSDKSILYETANESVDRRVRRVKIQPHGEHGLTINAKLDCQIKIR